MDIDQLMIDLDARIESSVSDSEEVFLKFLKEVWRVDYSVSPLDIFENVSAFKRSYFQNVFKDLKNRDQAERLISDWINLGASADFSTERQRYGKLIWELNALRSNLWQAAYAPGRIFQT